MHELIAKKLIPSVPKLLRWQRHQYTLITYLRIQVLILSWWQLCFRYEGFVCLFFPNYKYKVRVHSLRDTSHRQYWYRQNDQMTILVLKEHCLSVWHLSSMWEVLSLLMNFSPGSQKQRFYWGEICTWESLLLIFFMSLTEAKMPCKVQELIHTRDSLTS